MSVDLAPGQIVGTHLFEILDAQGIRQRWLARQMKIQESVLSNLQSGRRKWTPDLMASVSEVLRIPEHVLFFGLDSQVCDVNSHDREDPTEGAA